MQKDSSVHTGQAAMAVLLNTDSLKELIRQVVVEANGLNDWPAGRVALTEAEAAAACGVARHVLRDLRLAGRIAGRKLGRKVVYTRQDLLQAFDFMTDNGRSATNPNRYTLGNKEDFQNDR